MIYRSLDFNDPGGETLLRLVNILGFRANFSQNDIQSSEKEWWQLLQRLARK
jgi:hypothetical protein